MDRDTIGGETSPLPRAVRLTFTFQDDEISLESQLPLETIPPPTDPLSGYEGGQGFWIEVRNKEGETLYRQVRPDPFRQDVEVFSRDPDHSLARAPAERPSGIFTVLVPDLDEADHVILMSSTAPSRALRMLHKPTTPGLADSAAEVARFSLRSDGEAGGT